jgi:hypothetical protein
VVSQINAALAGTGMTASNPSGTTLEILDDGAANTVDVNSLTATAQTTSLTGDVALPLFVDGTSPYTGATTGGVPQSLGFAERIAVNQSLTLQLHFLSTSESMGHHDSGDHGWLAHRLRRHWSCGRHRCGR